MWPCGSRARHTGGTAAARRRRSGLPGPRMTGPPRGHPDAQQVGPVLVLVVILIGIDGLAVLGLRPRLDQDQLVVDVPAECQRPRPERLVERLVERSGVVDDVRRVRRRPRRPGAPARKGGRPAGRPGRRPGPSRARCWRTRAGRRGPAGRTSDRRAGRRCRPRSARGDRTDSGVETCPDSIPKRSPTDVRRPSADVDRDRCQPRAPSGAGGARSAAPGPRRARRGADLTRDGPARPPQSVSHWTHVASAIGVDSGRRARRHRPRPRRGRCRGPAPRRPGDRDLAGRDAAVRRVDPRLGEDRRLLGPAEGTQ